MAKRLSESQTSQDVLDLFISLQYEVLWLKFWEAGISSRPLPLSGVGQASNSVPYGHPAYPLAAEASWIMESLGRLLERHIADPGPTTLATNQPVPSRVSLIGLPLPAFRGVSNESVSQKLPAIATKSRFDLTDWGAGDKAEFASLAGKLRQVNDGLSGLDIALPASWDIVASSAVFNNLELDVEDPLRIIDRGSRQWPRRYASLEARASFIRQYEGPILVPPTVFTIDSIDHKEGSKLSNFRLVSPLRQRLGQSLEAAGEQFSVPPW